MMPGQVAWRVGAISGAVILLQLLQTRLFGFIYWNHLVYFIVTIALLGYGIAGTWLAFGPDSRLARVLTPRRAAFAFGATTLGSALGAGWLAIPTHQLFAGPWPLIALTLTYFLAVLPHFFAGWLLGGTFRDHPEKLHFLYGIDLVGAALGCLAFVVLIGPIGLPRLFWLTACLGLLPDAVAAPTRRSNVALLVFVAVGLGIHFWNTALTVGLPLEPTKSLHRDFRARAGAEAPVYEFTEWNPTSRVDVLSRPGQPLQKTIFIDGDAAQPLMIEGVAAPAPFVAERDFLLLKTSPYLFTPASSTILVIGSGGGADVLHALQSKARAIDAVEINPTICRLVADTYREANQGLFHRPGVVLHEGEGRSFLRRQSGLYDLILLNSIDTFSAMNSGAYVLSENYLYTLEAMADYLGHLRPDGILLISRWYGIPESLRLFVLALETLYKSGNASPEDHVLAHLCEDPTRRADQGGKHTAWMGLLIKKSPFTAEERQKHALQVKRNGGRLLFPPPPEERESIFGEYATVRRSGNQAGYFAALPFDVSPVTDDSPFLFNSERWSNLWPALVKRDFGFVARGEWPSLVLWVLTVFTLGLTALFIFLPLVFHRWQAASAFSLRASLPALTYFFALGTGFIFLEIALMQRFSLVLGHPARSLVMVLAILLLSAGTGSLLAGRFPWLHRACFPAIIGLACGAAFGLPPLLERLLPWSAPARYLGTVCLVWPLGFFLGIPFPTGLRRVGFLVPEAVPWMWGINGGATVFGSVLAIILAMTWGFTAVLLLAALAYLFAWAASRTSLITGVSADHGPQG